MTTPGPDIWRRSLNWVWRQLAQQLDRLRMRKNRNKIKNLIRHFDKLSDSIVLNFFHVFLKVGSLML
jgi:hypothetical protein